MYASQKPNLGPYERGNHIRLLWPETIESFRRSYTSVLRHIHAPVLSSQSLYHGHQNAAELSVGRKLSRQRSSPTHSLCRRRNNS